MNRRKLEKEGEKWVEDGIITDEQLTSILSHYEKKDHSYLLIILAALLVSISIFVFVSSDWAQIPNAVKILVMLLVMIILYAAGYMSFKKDGDVPEDEYDRAQIVGMSLIVLGFVTFGATLWLTLSMYNVELGTAWPFAVWSIVGLILYVITPNRYLFLLALLITIYGQIYSGMSFYQFDYVLFIIFFVAYFHYVYHRGYYLTHYVFAGGLAIQMLVLVLNEFEQFYWFIFFALAIYTLGLLLPKEEMKRRFTVTAVIAMLIYKIYETIYIQDEYILEELTFEPLFFILNAVLFIIVAFLVWRTDKVELISLILFIPFIILPYAHLYIIVSMFVFSVYWLIYAFQRHDNDKMMLGIFSFFMGTFTVIVQFAWETINKSLFFLVAGIILFLISMFYERRRRKEKEGGAE